ncbi:hypothetical protein [Microbacterium sp. P05]|uniref:hypothetical protein n=1 Tax=Microbacterium sp. P05 TaxID=3366948 RepID=UPI003745ECDA
MGETGVDEAWTVESIIVSENGQRALGRVAYWAAWVETSLTWVTVELLKDLGPARTAIAKGRTSGQLIELCRGLLEAGLEEPPGLSAVLNQAKAALDRRNQILHSAIGGALMRSDEEGLVALWSRKGASRVVHESEFDAVAQDLFEANEALGRFV